MSKATDAIGKIKKAIDKYGSQMKLVTLTEGAYDPYAGASTVRTETQTKGLITGTSTNEILNKVVDAYDFSVKMYQSTEITTDNLINFRGQDYKVLYVDTKVLQDETLIYELLVQK